ncbi:MAG TPA: PP2C family protein-serine/threonine phosphatase [Thermoanaerobaculia bacterium]|nr:PP2C family protein-serine/threonine phosphatase [Thermoanaerobaculia bacterium]
MERFTAQELAQPDEERAFRLRCDSRNISVARWLVWIFGLISFFQAVDGLERRDAGAVTAAILNIILCVVLRPVLRFMAGKRTANWIAVISAPLRPYPRGLIVVFLLIEFALIALAGRTAQAAGIWFVIAAFVLLPFCLAPAEYFLIHGGIVAAGIVMSLMLPGSWMAIVINLATNHSIALTINLVRNWRFRKRFVVQWRVASAQAREELRIRGELQTARELQLSMLPAGSPDIRGLDVAALSLPATEVGGDYYDYFELADGRLAVVIADVAGHGLSSGIVLSGIRSGLTILSDQIGEPATVLVPLQKMLRRTGGPRMLVTIAIAVVDPRRCCGSVTSAGHPPLIHYRAAEGRSVVLDTESVPLGVGLADEFAKRELALAHGDVLLLHTDGVYETMNRKDEPFGLDALASALARHAPGHDAAAIRDNIVADLTAFRGDAPQGDDITLVVVRIAGDAYNPIPS